MTNRLAYAALAVCLVVLAAGAGTSTQAARASSTTDVQALPRPFTITARYSAKSLGLKAPRALAIAPSGNLYATDFSQRLSVISPSGKVLRRWGKRGSRPGEFHFIGADPSDPTDIHGKIAVGPTGLVYISDSGNARVQVFTPRGRFVRQFGSFGSGKGQFLDPLDLAVDEAGAVYVVDNRRLTLTKFSPSNEVVWQIGGRASPDPDLVGHLHLQTIDAHGRLVLANDDRSRILYVDRNGHKVDAFGTRKQFPGGDTCEVTVDAAGATYVDLCCPRDCPTLVFDRTHRLVALWPGKPYSLFRGPVFGSNGEAFALGADGSVLTLRMKR